MGIFNFLIEIFCEMFQFLERKKNYKLIRFQTKGGGGGGGGQIPDPQLPDSDFHWFAGSFKITSDQDILNFYHNLLVN